ncbi:MAG: FeoB-associated Cys-rich membrane protein [Desulfobacterales bacterium]|nr:FeoB-associated Cys-rich membrane protein [Desulfobacterales bacterium]
MDSIIVGIIVIAVVAFCVRNFVKTYKGEESCTCKEGCSCSSAGFCKPDFPIANKK